MTRDESEVRRDEMPNDNIHVPVVSSVRSKDATGPARGYYQAGHGFV